MTYQNLLEFHLKFKKRRTMTYKQCRNLRSKDLKRRKLREKQSILEHERESFILLKIKKNVQECDIFTPHTIHSCKLALVSKDQKDFCSYLFTISHIC